MIELPAHAPAGVITSDVRKSDVGCFPTREQYFGLVSAFKADGFELCADL